jgi:membrane protein DedA with SNARE-associated domain
LAYALGRGVRPRAERSRRGRTALRWLEGRDGDWAPGLIVAGRFIPGGATAVAVSAGILGYPFHRFAVFAALGAVLWTGYGVSLAFLGRAAFPDNPWASTLLAVALVLVLSGLLHLWRVRQYGRER